MNKINAINEEKRNDFINLLLRERKSNPMSLRRKRDEKQATQHPNGDRQRREELLGFLGGIRNETLDHILIKQSHRKENDYGQQRVEEIDESQPVFFPLLRRNPTGHNPQPSKRGQPIPDFAPFVPEAVGEAEEEAGETAKGD